MTKTEEVKEIFSKLEDDISDTNSSEEAAVLVSEAEEKILTIVALLEADSRHFHLIFGKDIRNEQDIRS